MAESWGKGRLGGMVRKTTLSILVMEGLSKERHWSCNLNYRIVTVHSYVNLTEPWGTQRKHYFWVHLWECLHRRWNLKSADSVTTAFPSPGRNHPVCIKPIRATAEDGGSQLRFCLSILAKPFLLLLHLDRQASLIQGVSDSLSDGKLPFTFMFTQS